MHASRPLLLVASLAASLAACSPGDAPVAPVGPTAAVTTAPTALAPRAVTGYPLGVTRYLLEQAAAGLTYTSESDYPFTWWQHVGPVAAPLDEAAFRAALALAPEVRVETVDLDQFFGRHIEWVDPYDTAAQALVPRYQELRETIRRTVRDPVVFRVGRVQVDCYVVGLDRAGNLVGLRTVAIET